MPLPHVSETIAELLAEFRQRRDSEVQALAEVLPQYVQDHRDKAAYAQVDRQVNALAKSIDRMIAWLEKAEAQAAKIEAGVENFYGE